MSKRLLCLLLCLLMLLPAVLTGCGNKDDGEVTEDINEEASKSTTTLSLYLMSEKPVSEDQEKAIEDAVNKITKSKFKTKIDIRYFTADMYNAALEKAFKDAKDAKDAKKAAEQALKEAIKKGEVTTVATTTTVQTEEETVLNEYGVSELKYPPINDYQVDILYLGGYDKFMEYTDNKWLSKLDQELSSSSKLLNDYISPVYLSTMKTVTGITYALPTNAVYGEYTYLLLNKEVLAEWDYSAEDGFTSLTCNSVQDLLNKVSKYNTEYIPLWSGTGELDVINVAYLGLDENGKYSTDFSIFGGVYDSSYVYKGQNQFYSFGNIFNNAGFRSQVKTLVGYKESGYYGTQEDAGKPFAVGYVKGGAELVDQYSDDYEVIVVDNPKFSTEDLFGNTFAVGAYTSSVSRSMEIVTYLNTNVDFRNLILYGIEGVNYEIVEKTVQGEKYKTVRRLNEDYMMDVHKTGNELIAYPLEDEIGEIDIRKYQKAQLNDAIARLDIGFYADFDKNKYIAEDETGIPNINQNAMKIARELSAQYYPKILECKTVLEWENLADTVVGVMNKNDAVKLMLDANYSFDSLEYESKSKTLGQGCSFSFVYMAWLKKNGIYVAGVD